MTNVKILVCAHKMAQIPTNKYFYPIQVGANLSDIKLPFIPDNTGDNISSKNLNYCELTAMYWAWKNLKDVDIIGLNHYRRYFDFNNKYPLISPEFSFIDSKDFLQSDYKFPDLEELLSKYDIVLSAYSCHPISISKQYCLFHIANDWEILHNVIKALSPEYDNAFVQTMDKSNRMSDFNMFITNWDIFNKYCQWLFMILFETERRVYISQYSDQARIFGFMSERLLNVFCEKEKLRIKYIPTVMPLDNFRKWMNTPNLSYFLRRIRYNIAFKIAY